MREFQPNDSINGRYTVLRKLGAGAMGSVYLCEDRVEKNIKVALKVLVSDDLDDQDVWAKGEYEALTRLRHPNLARVYNFGRIEGSNDYFIVSEFIKGLDLYSSTEYQNYAEITEIVVQICRALEYIHSQGYVHFDIKPDNILVTRRKTIGIKEGSKVEYDEDVLNSSCGTRLSKPVAKLIDFGLAEKITGSFSFAIKGTLNYLAPEMLGGQNPDKRADLYSLGVTIYQIVNRDLPFYQDFGFEAFGGRRAKRSELFEVHMKKHPEYIRALILGLIEEDPDDRIQTAREVIQLINKVSEFNFELETDETRESYFHAPRLIGRKKEMNLLKRLQELAFFPDRARPVDTESETEPEVEPSPAGGEVEAAESVSSEAEPQSRADIEGVDESGQRLEDAALPEDDDDVFAGSSAVGDSLFPRVVVVSGEMGCGKSRLLEEFKHYLTLNDINVFAGNCYEASGKAYQPIVEILRQVICAVGLESNLVRTYADHCLKLLPELQDSLPGAGKGLGGSRPEKEQHHFHDRIAQLLVEAADECPYLMVLNNLHWIDDATLHLFEKLCDRVVERVESGRPLKFLLIVSQRIGEQSTSRCQTILNRMSQIGFATELPVRRLRLTSVREYLQAMLGFTDVPEEFVERLCEQTGGNPLFIVETLKALQDEGIIKKQAGVWTIKLTRQNRVEIPQRMEDLLLKRLDRLEPIKRQLIEVMAVLDKPVSPKLLQRFKRFQDAPVLVELRDLETAGIVRKLFENNKLMFQIEQPKVREILYENLSTEQSKQYHGEVGATYEEVYRRRQEEILEELAFHYRRSDKTDKAVQMALLAGDRLKSIYANEEALEYYQFALEEVIENDSQFEVYFDTREKLGDLCTTLGRYKVADEHYSALLGDDNRSLLSPARVTTLYLRRGKLFEIQGDYDRALSYYKEARNHLATFGKDSQIVERARVFNAIGWAYVCMGKYEKAMMISLEALRVIASLPEQMEHAMIYSTIGSANYYKGNIQEAVKYHRKSLQIKEHLENIPEIAMSLNNLGGAHLEGAEYGESLEQLRRALSTSEEIGDPYGKAMSLHSLARLYTQVGDLTQAEEFLERSIEQAKTFNMRYLNLQNYLVRGMIQTEQEDYAKAEGSFFRVLTAFSKQGNRAGLCSILLRVAEIYRLNGNLAEARSMVDEAQGYAVELGITPLVVRCLLEQARQERVAEQPDYDRALELLDEANGKAEKGDNPEVPGEIHFEIAEMLVCKREVSQAKQHYRTAHDRLGEVLDSLPAELQDAYSQRLRARFPQGGESTAEASPNESSAASGQPAVRAEPGELVTPEESLKRVQSLMAALTECESKSAFLGLVVEQVLAVSQAEFGCILSLDGRNLSVVTTRTSPGVSSANPGQLLCLTHINRALRKQQPYLLVDASEDPMAQQILVDVGFDIQTLTAIPFLEPDGKRGALYLLNASYPPERADIQLLLLQPFVNLVTMAYLQFQCTEVPTA